MELHPRRLTDFLREHHEQIVARWEEAVRRLRPAKSLSRPALLDHIPDFLREIAAYVERARDGEDVPPPRDIPTVHALERLDLGYDLGEVVLEYGALRTSITELAQEEHTPALLSAELPLLHEALDLAVSVSVTRYAHARERTLKALDRISTAALTEPTIDAFLPRILQAVLETTPSVDSASVLLVEGDHLRVHAAAGFAPLPQEAAPLARGECLAGKVWESGQPLGTRDAEHDPRVTSQTIRKPGTRAMYGAPLHFGAEIVGVALIGSCSTHDFSHEDLLLFRTAASRIAALVAQANLSEAAARQKALYETVVQALGDLGEGFAIVERRRVALVNDALCRIVGRSAEELYAMHDVLDLAVPAQRDALRDTLRRRLEAAAEPGERVEASFLHRDGHAVDVEIGLKRKPNGRVVAIVRDVSSRRALERERERNEEELRGELAFRERILSILAHDLRQPLSAVTASASLLLRKPDLGPHADVVRRQLRNTERMDRLIGDLLDYARARQGQGVPVARRPVRLPDVLRQVIESMESIHPDRAFRFECRGECAGSFDPDRLLQVFGNLLGNAIAYSPPGSPVDVALRDEGAWVTTEVHNGGRAIPADGISSLFEAFRRGEPGSNPQGLGLGLFIVERIVAAHGGSVSVASSDEQGTTFSVRLPKA